MKNLLYAGLIAFTFTQFTAYAATQYWDADGSGAGNDALTGAGLGGSNNWDPGTASWWDGVTEPLAPWLDGNDAVFTGTAGSINLTTPVTANSLTFKTDAYQVSGSSLTLTGAALFDVQTGTTTFGPTLLGTNGYNKIGSGTLLLNNTANTVSGPVSITGGVLQMPSGAPIGSTVTNSGDVTLNGGTFRNTSATAAGTLLTTNRAIIIGANGGTIDIPTSSQILLFAGNMTGASNTLKITGPGELRITTNSMVPTAGHYGFGKLVVDGAMYTLGQSVTGAAEDSFGAVPASPTADAITLMNGGRLRGNVYAITLSANRGITIGAGGGLIRTVNAVSTLTIPSPITGGNPLTIGAGSDNGTIAIGNTNNSFGNLTITGPGALRLDASGVIPDTSAVTLGATLNLNGATETVGALTLLTNTMIFPGSLTASSIDAQGPTIRYDFGGAGYPASAMVKSTGDLAANGTVTVNVKGVNTNGTATLLEYATRSGGGSFTLGTVPPHMSGSISEASQKVTLTLTGDSLRWAGDASANWDVNNSGNNTWKLLSGGTATYYQENTMQGDTVRFDDTGTATTVNFLGPVAPFAVVVDNSSKDYTFVGSGTPVNRITGAGSVIKSGTGQLSILNSNTYSGGLTINAGTLLITNSTALGSGTFTINGGTIKSDSSTARTFTNSVKLNGNVTLGASGLGNLTFSTGSWTVSGAARQITVPSGAGSAIVSAVIGGSGGLTKEGPGNLDLTGANTFTGGFALNGGSLRVNNATALGAAGSPASVADGVTLSTTAGTGRNLNYTWTVNGNITLGQVTGGTAAVTMSGSMDLGGVNRTFTLLNAADTISAPITNGGITVTSGGSAATLTISGANNYNGDTIVTNGATASVTGVNSGSGNYVVHQGSTLQVNGTSILNSGTVTLNNANFLATANRTVAISNAIVLNGDNTFPIATAGAGNRFFYLAGPMTMNSGTLTLRNTGTTNGIWNVRFHYPGLNLNRPIVIGLAGDTGLVQLSSYNTSDVAAQTISGILSGNGSVNRSALTAGTGGTTIITGDNTYSGGTVVNDGTLLVNNVVGSGTGSGAVTLASRGVLGGNGIIAGAVSGTGAISAGMSAPGLLTLGGGLDLSSGGTNIWELGANSTNTPGTQFDQIVLTGGNLVLGPASRLLVKFVGSATFPDASNPFWQTAHTWTIISGTGTAANPTSAAFGSVIGANGNNAGIFTTSADASGNVYLTFTPGAASAPTFEPAILNAGTTNSVINWSAVNGLTYEVQFKNDLSAASWTSLGSVTATNSTASITDPNNPVAPQRFYRIVVQ